MLGHFCLLVPMMSLVFVVLTEAVPVDADGGGGDGGGDDRHKMTALAFYCENGHSDYCDYGRSRGLPEWAHKS